MIVLQVAQHLHSVVGLQALLPRDQGGLAASGQRHPYQRPARHAQESSAHPTGKGCMHARIYASQPAGVRMFVLLTRWSCSNLVLAGGRAHPHTSGEETRRPGAAGHGGEVLLGSAAHQPPGAAHLLHDLPRYVFSHPHPTLYLPHSACAVSIATSCTRMQTCCEGYDSNAHGCMMCRQLFIYDIICARRRGPPGPRVCPTERVQDFCEDSGGGADSWQPSQLWDLPVRPFPLLGLELWRMSMLLAR